MSIRQNLTDLARHIESQIGDFGFALLLQQNKRTAYLSNARRKDVHKMLGSWLKKDDCKIREIHKTTSAITGEEEYDPYIDPKTAARDPFQSYDRVRMQRLCAKIGEEIGAHADVILFLFNFEPGGSMACWVNVPNAKKVVTEWISGKGRQAWKTRHNGHTFYRQSEYRVGWGSRIRINFRCEVCGLEATAEKYGVQWTNWSGPGAHISCGDAIAKKVMES